MGLYGCAHLVIFAPAPPNDSRHREYGPVTIAIPHTYAVTGPIVVPSGATGYLPTFFMPVPPGQTCALVGVRYMIRTPSDSCTIEIQQNGTNITGMTGLSVTSSPTTTTLSTAMDVFDNDHFNVVVTAIGTAPDGLSATFYFHYQIDL